VNEFTKDRKFDCDPIPHNCPVAGLFDFKEAKNESAGRQGEQRKIRAQQFTDADEDLRRHRQLGAEVLENVAENRDDLHHQKQ